MSSRRRRLNSSDDEGLQRLPRARTQATQSTQGRNGRAPIRYNSDSSSAHGEDEGPNDVDFDLAANSLVRFALAQSYKRQSIRADDILKAILPKATRKVRNKLGRIVELANERLQNVFQMELVQAKTGNVKRYEMKNLLPLETTAQLYDKGYLSRPKDCEKEYALTLLVLSLIYTNGGALPHASFEHHLDQLGFNNNTPNMNLKTFLASLIRANWIDKAKMLASDDVEYKLGSRALAEIGPEGITAFILSTFPPDKQTQDEISRGIEASSKEK